MAIAICCAIATAYVLVWVASSEFPWLAAEAAALATIATP